MPDASLPLIKGTLDVLVLKSLTWGPQHGFGIACWLEERSHGVLGVDDSALYQALQRMEERGLVAAEWGLTENNRRARFYTTTTAGRQQLRAQTSSWLRYSDAVTGILTTSARTA